MFKNSIPLFNMFNANRTKISQIIWTVGNEMFQLTEESFLNIIEDMPVIYYAIGNKPPYNLLYISK